MYEEVCARGLSPDPGSLRSSEGGSGQGGTGVRSLPELAPAGPRSSGPQGGPCAGTGRNPAWGGPGRQDAPEAGPRPLCAGASFFLKGCSQKAPQKLSLPRSFQSWPPAHLGPAGRCRGAEGDRPSTPGPGASKVGGLGLLVPGSTVRSRREARSLPCAGWPRLPGRLTCVAPVQGPGRARRVPEGARALGQEGHLDSPGSRMAVGWGGGEA